MVQSSRGSGRQAEEVGVESEFEGEFHPVCFLDYGRFWESFLTSVIARGSLRSNSCSLGVARTSRYVFCEPCCFQENGVRFG